MVLSWPCGHQAADQADETVLGDAALGVGGPHQAADQVVAGGPAPLGEQSGAEGGELRERRVHLVLGPGAVGEGVFAPVAHPATHRGVEAHQAADHGDRQRQGELGDGVHRSAPRRQVVQELVDDRGDPGAPPGDGPRGEGPAQGAAQPQVLDAVLVEHQLRVVHQSGRLGAGGAVLEVEPGAAEPAVAEHLPYVGVAVDQPAGGTVGQGARPGRSRLGGRPAVERGERRNGFGGGGCCGGQGTSGQWACGRGHRVRGRPGLCRSWRCGRGRGWRRRPGWRRTPGAACGRRPPRRAAGGRRDRRGGPASWPR